MVIKGFTVVPVMFDKTKSGVHYMYLKQHEVRQNDETKPKGRTVFVGNLPPWVTEMSLQNAFCCCGVVEKVILQRKPGHDDKAAEDFRPGRHMLPKMNHRVAYIVFAKNESVDKALHLAYSTPLILSTKKQPIIHGLAEYKNLYLKSRTKQVDKDKLIEAIKEYDKKEQEKEEALKNSGPDEEGWVTVTRVGKNKGAPRTQNEQERVLARRRKKKLELTNFYAFQIREEKKQKIEELKAQFAKDRSKVEQMRAQRKFKPY